MKVIGLCGEANIEVNGCGHYLCHKSCFGLVSKSAKPTDLCLECDFAKCNNEENSESKIEDTDKTVSKLCDIIANLSTELYQAKNDIGALLFLNGNCEYCANGQVEKYCGAECWSCKLGNGTNCKPVWRGIQKESEEE